MPSDAARPIRAGLSTWPACSTTSPTCTSSARRRTLAPRASPAGTSTMSPSSTALSLISTVSVPSGMGAPVVMRTHWPVAGARPRSRPANCSPARRSAVAASGCKSAWRRAKPSIALLSKPGKATGATTSAANTRPSAREVGTRSAAGRRAALTCPMMASASSSEMRVGKSAWSIGRLARSQGSAMRAAARSWGVLRLPKRTPRSRTRPSPSRCSSWRGASWPSATIADSARRSGSHR